MYTTNKKKLFISIIAIIFSSLTCIAYAERVDDLIDAQKEVKKNTQSKKEKLSTQKRELAETRDAITMGKKEYERTCSLCHGIDAKGNGVYAFELTIAPPDLTLIEKKNYGVFPFSNLYKIIDGREEVHSHGARDMPVWGDRFNSESWLDTNQRNSETLARGRIFELLLYLETIQK